MEKYTLKYDKKTLLSARFDNARDNQYLYEIGVMINFVLRHLIKNDI